MSVNGFDQMVKTSTNAEPHHGWVPSISGLGWIESQKKMKFFWILIFCSSIVYNITSNKNVYPLNRFMLYIVWIWIINTYDRSILQSIDNLIKSRTYFKEIDRLSIPKKYLSPIREVYKETLIIVTCRENCRNCVSTFLFFFGLSKKK